MYVEIGLMCLLPLVFVGLLCLVLSCDGSIHPPGPACGKCKTVLKPSAKFCQKCGVAISPPALVEDPNLIIRKVKVDRTRTSQQALDATGRRQCTDKSVVEAMPRGEGDEVEVIFFKPRPEEYTRPGWMSDDDLEKALDRRNLKAAPPDDVAGVDAADPAFADEKPHGTHWKDAKGNWCYAAFRRWSSQRRVGVGRDDVGWGDYWWFAGSRK
jgi:hypothetical protein